VRLVVVLVCLCLAGCTASAGQVTPSPARGPRLVFDEWQEGLLRKAGFEARARKAADSDDAAEEAAE